MSYLRICIRYGAERKEGCAIKVEGGGNGIVMSAAEHALFRGRIGKPQVAICPHCGEVSIYAAEIDKLKKLLWCKAFAHGQRPSARFDKGRLTMPHSFQQGLQGCVLHFSRNQGSAHAMHEAEPCMERGMGMAFCNTGRRAG